jgi:hypothetical protein
LVRALRDCVAKQQRTVVPNVWNVNRGDKFNGMTKRLKSEAATATTADTSDTVSTTTSAAAPAAETAAPASAAAAAVNGSTVA